MTLLLSPAQAAVKTYWHITLQAWIDVDKAEEWVWVTMVEMPKEEVFPETAEMVKQLGGVFPGTILAHVQGAAWRSEHAYTKDRKCKGRKSKIEISWKSSWSDLVFAHGRVLDSSRYRSELPYLFRFQLGLCDEQVLMEDGRQRQVRDLVNPLVGPINVGGEREEWLGKPRLDGITYDDMFVHYKFCGRSWVEQLKTPLMHYDSTNLVSSFVDSPDRTTGVDDFQFHEHSIDVIYLVVRSPSREHPDWKLKRMPGPSRR